MGNGSVHILKDGAELEFSSGEIFDLQRLGEFNLPESGKGIKPRVWEQALAANRSRQASDEVPEPPQSVLSILEQRKSARAAEEWAKADALRVEIEALGWKVMDTAKGVELVPMENNESPR